MSRTDLPTMNATATATARYIAVLTNDKTCLAGDTITMEIVEADIVLNYQGTGLAGEDIEVEELDLSDRIVLTVDTGIEPGSEQEERADWDDFIPAGWRKAGDWEAQTSAYTVEVVPDDPDMVPAPELPAGRVREILRDLNAHAATHDDHAHAEACGCNPFEDVAYRLDEYDGALTEKRYRDEEYAFVLVDGTEIELDGSTWTAARYHHTPDSLKSGDPGDRIQAWHLTGDAAVVYTHLVEASQDGNTWEAEPGASMVYEETSLDPADYAAAVLAGRLEDLKAEPADSPARALHYRVLVWPGHPHEVNPQESSATATHAPSRDWTLTVVEGAQPYSNGHELGGPESPISYDQLDEATIAWLEEQGYTADNPDTWVLVTPDGEDPNAPGVSRTVTITA